MSFDGIFNIMTSDAVGSDGVGSDAQGPLCSGGACPVVVCMDEIRGGGFYADDCETTSDRAFKIGGSDTAVHILDDVAYYISSRKMALARFELAGPMGTGPTPADILRTYKRMFGDIVGRDYTQLYTLIVDRALAKQHIYSQFTRAVDLMAEIENLISMRVERLAVLGSPSLNMSLPDIFLLPHIDRVIMYRPDVLAHTVNKIIDWVNKLEVSCLLPAPVRSNIGPVKPFAATPPPMDTVIEPVAAPTIADLRATLAQEMVVAAYVHKVEEYQCYVINHMNAVFDLLHKLAAGLSDSKV